MGSRKSKAKSKRRGRSGRAGQAASGNIGGAAATAGFTGGGGGAIAGQRAERRARFARPRSWPDELAADVAVFDVARRAELPDELARQAADVAEALKEITEHRDAAALQLVEPIARSSPLSEWRLFLRGLVDWYADQFDAADNCWRRLDPQRRPARIALALQLARKPAGQDNDPASDEALRKAGRLVHEIRIDRPALVEAVRETSRKPTKKDERIGLATLKWLGGFRTSYRASEPELIRTMELTALGLAFHQPYVDAFEWCARSISGPPHDPFNRLLQSRYMDQFVDARSESARLLGKYLKQDLPKCTSIAEPVRKAIESLLHLEEARGLSNPASPSDEPFSFFFRSDVPRRDNGKIGKAYQTSLKAYPANGECQREHADWLKEQLEAPRLDKKQKAALELKLTLAMEGWAQALPDAVEPRMWLVDHYLDNDRIEEAEAHIKALQNARLEDPRIRSLPWRHALLDAMRLARRKLKVSEAGRSLDRAEALWPAWLSRDWLLFLRAALALRGGEVEAYERLRMEAGTGCSEPTCEAVMMLAAAQRMHVASNDLRPLRDAVNERANSVKSIEMTDLLGLGAFFWDLVRTNLMYPGYRNHGSKFGREMVKRLSWKNAFSTELNVGPAALWGSEYGFWAGGAMEVPTAVSLQAKSNPMCAAGILRMLLKERWAGSEIARRRDYRGLILSAAQKDPDPFYRHLYQTIWEEAETAVAGNPQSWTSGWGPGPRDLDFIFGMDDDDDDDDDVDDDDDDDDDDDFEDDDDEFDRFNMFGGSPDGPCMCPDCKRKRQAEERAKARSPQVDNAEPVPHPRRRAQPHAIDTSKAGDETTPAEFERDLDEFPSPDTQSGPSAIDGVPRADGARDGEDLSRAEELKMRRRRNPLDPKNKRRGKGRRS